MAKESTNTSQSKTREENGLEFIKGVATYFMDFLETDFHKRRTPKRAVKLHSDKNLLIGINLNKYPTFRELVWKAVDHTFDKEKLSKIGKGVYKTNIPKDLLDLISLRISKISVGQVSQIVETISKEIETAASTHKEQYSTALSSSLDNASEIIRNELVLPFVKDIEQPLKALNLGDDNTVYLMEEELTTILVSSLKDSIAETLRLLIIEGDANTLNRLEAVFGVTEVKNKISDFFENFKALDLFTEVFEMARNKDILDKQEFYLYFCDISFNKKRYPIFYIPFSIDKRNGSLFIDFDAQVYVNKKALGYIVQEYNKQTGKRGSLKTASERIIYLAQHKDDFSELINSILGEMIDVFDLDSEIDITDPKPQTSKSSLVKVSNNCFISLFDKSDEALINDYENILQLLTEGDSVLAEAFNKLIDDFIYKEPEPFREEIQDGWEELDTSDKLVVASPIPLNSEQRQILSAVNKSGCKYITVEGPPGTGKSHTITAIVFNAILKNHSVLVLSDKKEALDVVENKITGTLNKVRFDKNFQNPILRLGKTGNTYSKILATSSVKNIADNYRAVKKDYENLEENIDKSMNTLKEALDAEVYAYENIDIAQICELFSLEFPYEAHGYPVDIGEVLEQPEAAIELEELRKILMDLKKMFLESEEEHSDILKLIGFSAQKFEGLSGFRKYLGFLPAVFESINKLENVFGGQLESIKHFEKFSDGELEKLVGFVTRYDELRSKVFGYFFKKDKVKKLDTEFKKAFPHSKFDYPHQELRNLRIVTDIFEFAVTAKEDLPKEYISQIDYLALIHQLLKNSEILDLLNTTAKFDESLDYLNKHFRKYPKTQRKIKLDLSSFDTLYKNTFTQMGDLEFGKLIRYIDLRQKIEKDFNRVSSPNYGNQKGGIESLVTTKMTYLMDKRVVDFDDRSKKTAKLLRTVIRNKLKFPKEEFTKLKNAFPCILAGIRDYAEYIPLEPEMFDLVVIDEASQVSIAQAFPALLRAKKVVIFGDRKQFSNIKAAHARSETNRERINRLRDIFKRHVSDDPAEEVKLEKFNIRTSILEFLDFISNYNIQLLKHFRGYKEIISYSNKHFYQDNLQVMKIRGKPIDDVLVFTFIKHDGKIEIAPNTNRLEVEFIISELRKLKERDNKVSVGIITPHTNQQKLIAEMINSLPERDYFFDELNLKIMTFDTCQGEERDIIFYSMVATEELDRLWGVFIKDLSSVDLEEGGKIKAQRLNVGFSRAKECMHFVMSKPLDKYSGSIGEALRHYYYALEQAKKEPLPDEVDPKSPMEAQVLNWLTQTKFYKDNSENIEIRPSFELGKYLRQLDRTYNHPDYVVDFLLIYKDEGHREHKIIIEYDGFEYHFKKLDEVSEFNYEHYYSDEDVYREKVLEGYGYKFLRINKFNAGKDPITTLDKRLGNLVRDHPTSSRNLLSSIQKTVEGLQNKEMKECPRCKKVKDLEYFRDPSLIKGYGRICSQCKGVPATLFSERGFASGFEDADNSLCPKCGSRMVLRTGRYGAFYGCPRYPYCRGTRRFT